MNKSIIRRFFRLRNLLILAISIIVVVSIFALTLNPEEPTDNSTQAPTANSETKGESASESNPQTSPSFPHNESNKDRSSTVEAQLAIRPSDLVSAHKVTLMTPISSVCNATAGASCKIVFTKNGDTKSLEAMTTDRGGSAYWNSWTPQSIGLTPGAWTIQAIASLNNETKSTIDALKLEVTE